jgi:hypothetical protein
MTNMVSKVEEARVRRIARRRGFTLKKSPRRDPLAIDFNRYLLIDALRDCVVFGDQPFRFAATLGEVGKVLDKIRVAPTPVTTSVARGRRTARPRLRP